MTQLDIYLENKARISWGPIFIFKHSLQKHITCLDLKHCGKETKETNRNSLLYIVYLCNNFIFLKNFI